MQWSWMELLYGMWCSRLMFVVMVLSSRMLFAETFCFEQHKQTQITTVIFMFRGGYLQTSVHENKSILIAIYHYCMWIFFMNVIMLNWFFNVSSPQELNHITAEYIRSLSFHVLGLQNAKSKRGRGGAGGKVLQPSSSDGESILLPNPPDRHLLHMVHAAVITN